jgi:hypothetical protein
MVKDGFNHSPNTLAHETRIGPCGPFRTAVGRRVTHFICEQAVNRFLAGVLF